MTAIISTLQAFFRAVAAIFGFAQTQQLKEAGKAEAEAKSLSEMHDATARAIRARAAVDHSPSAVMLDPENRDIRP